MSCIVRELLEEFYRITLEDLTGGTKPAGFGIIGTIKTGELSIDDPIEKGNKARCVLYN